MKLFSTWSRTQVVTAITSIEENLAAGIQSVSNPSQGSVSYSSPDNAFTILRSLYRRLDEIDNVKPTNTGGPRIIKQRISGGSF